MNRTKKLVLMAVLAAAALAIFVAEAQIPPLVPIPGMKPGLANIITLVTMAVLGRREAGAVLTVRILLGSLFTGSVSALIFSVSGGLLAYAAMCLTVGLFPRKRLWVPSVLGAVAHNAGQLLAAFLITQTPGILYYGFALLASAIVTGAFTGAAAVYLARAAEKIAKIN